MVQSFFVGTQEGAVRYLILDTVIAGKHVFTAMGVGRVHKGDAQLTPTARDTLMALADYAQSQQLGAINLVEIATVIAAPVRVTKALERAHEKDVVFFVCRDPHIYDAAFEQLRVQWADAPGVH